MPPAEQHCMQQGCCPSLLHAPGSRPASRLSLLAVPALHSPHSGGCVHRQPARVRGAAAGHCGPGAAAGAPPRLPRVVCLLGGQLSEGPDGWVEAYKRVWIAWGGLSVVVCWAGPAGQPVVLCGVLMPAVCFASSGVAACLPCAAADPQHHPSSLSLHLCSAGARPGAHHHHRQLAAGLWLPAGQRHPHRVMVRCCGAVPCCGLLVCRALSSGCWGVGDVCVWVSGCGGSAEEVAGTGARARAGQGGGRLIAAPPAAASQLGNSVPPLCRYDDDGDDELLKLLPFLEKVAHAEDVRPHIQVRRAALCCVVLCCPALSLARMVIAASAGSKQRAVRPVLGTLVPPAEALLAVAIM